MREAYLPYGLLARYDATIRVVSIYDINKKIASRAYSQKGHAANALTNAEHGILRLRSRLQAEATSHKIALSVCRDWGKGGHRKRSIDRVQRVISVDKILDKTITANRGKLSISKCYEAALWSSIAEEI